MIATLGHLVIRFQYPALFAFCLAAAVLTWALLCALSRWVSFSRFRLLAPLLAALGICMIAAGLVSFYRSLTGPVWRYECFGVWRLPPERTCHFLILLFALLSALVFRLVAAGRPGNREAKGDPGEGIPANGHKG